MNNYPNSSYSNKNSGLNRDYFNKPAYGMKFSFYESKVDATTSIGLNFSYLWTQSESSDFYASNYTRISFVIGFGRVINFGRVLNFGKVILLTT